jgi:transcription antitermination factor NusG
MESAALARDRPQANIIHPIHRCDSAQSWHVLHTRSRQEKALALDLVALGMEYYLPLVRKVVYYGRRKVEVDSPLFPSYLFLWGTKDQAYLADQTKRVARLINVADQNKLHWELRNIQTALSKVPVLDPHPFLQRGMRVEVRAGPFRGLQGLVEERRTNDRLVLQVETFGRAVSLEIDGSLLDPIG